MKGLRQLKHITQVNLAKKASIHKKILTEVAPKALGGVAEGVLLGGAIGPTAAYLAGDGGDVRKQLIMGLAGGAGAGATRPFVRQMLMSPNMKTKAVGYAIMSATGLATSITSRKLAQKMKLWDRRKKWRDTYHENKDQREKEERREQRRIRKQERLGVSQMPKDKLSVS